MTRRVVEGREHVGSTVPEQDDEVSVRRRERVTLVATKLPDAIRQRNIGPVIPGFTIGAGALLGGLYLASGAEHTPVLMGPRSPSPAGTF